MNWNLIFLYYTSCFFKITTLKSFQPYRKFLRPEQKILVCPLPRFSSQLLIFCQFVFFSFISFSLNYFVCIVNPVKIKKLKLIQNYHPLHSLHSKVVMYLQFPSNPRSLLIRDPVLYPVLYAFSWRRQWQPTPVL